MLGEDIDYESLKGILKEIEAYKLYKEEEKNGREFDDDTKIRMKTFLTWMWEYGLSSAFLQNGNLQRNETDLLDAKLRGVELGEFN